MMHLLVSTNCIPLWSFTSNFFIYMKIKLYIFVLLLSCDVVSFIQWEILTNKSFFFLGGGGLNT